ncbi:hypothetical protein BD410DRAFT_878188 [Rickenella mellea]|uniref:Uncharacterized protein n=1 Tax=Rickenella mellea TaxID=50990 RepID=A0A4Y7PG09_9AGAM|nr:hypothetical protein BD410DRAFT_878188 [Rickenella mellea]
MTSVIRLLVSLLPLLLFIYCLKYGTLCLTNLVQTAVRVARLVGGPQLEAFFMHMYVLFKPNRPVHHGFCWRQLLSDRDPLYHSPLPVLPVIMLLSPLTELKGGTWSAREVEPGHYRVQRDPLGHRARELLESLPEGSVIGSSGGNLIRRAGYAAYYSPEEIAAVRQQFFRSVIEGLSPERTTWPTLREITSRADMWCYVAFTTDNPNTAAVLVTYSPPTIPLSDVRTMARRVPGAENLRFHIERSPHSATTFHVHFCDEGEHTLQSSLEDMGVAHVSGSLYH